MDEERGEDAGGGGSGEGWWGSWYKAAKEKSVEVLQFVKRDLDEFSTTVKSEATNVVTSTTSALKDKLRLDEPESTANNMKKSVSSFFGQVSNVLNPMPDDEDEEAYIIHDSEPVVLTKYQIQQLALINNDDTFLTDLEEKYEKQFEAWLDIAEDQLSTERLSKLMTASPELHTKYISLVPSQVSHQEFWQRYLFRKALLEDEEARRQAMQKRIERERQAAENFLWNQETDFGANVEISEEEQTRLLLEYEKECQNKKLLRSNSARDASEDALLLESEMKENYYAIIPESRSEPALSSNVSSSPLKEKAEREPTIEDSNETKEKSELIVGDSCFRTKEKRDMVIISDANTGSCQTSSCSGDKESNDDDWEKEFDLEDSEVDTVSELQQQQTVEKGKV